MLSKEVLAHPTLTTATLTLATAQAAPNCLHYQVKGLCYWWVNDGLVGHPVTTLKVSHFLPDVVVSVFDRHGDNPWWEARTLYDEPAYQVAKTLLRTTRHLRLGGGRHSLASPHDTGVTFKEVTIAGNPGVYAAYHACVILNKAAIPPAATPLALYFSSLLDVLAWRLGAEALSIGVWASTKVVGTENQPWGSLYPRDGFVVAANDGTAASVGLMGRHPTALAVSLSLRQVSVECLSALVVMSLAGVPCQLLDPHYEQATATHTQTTFDHTLALNPTQAAAVRVPLWWYGVIALTEGLTHALRQSAIVPLDLRQLITTVHLTPLRDPHLRQQLTRFYQQCYTPARHTDLN